MFIFQTGLTFFYKWPITCEIQILNLIKCGSGICNRCDQRLFLLASRFFHLAKSLWNKGMVCHACKLIQTTVEFQFKKVWKVRNITVSTFQWWGLDHLNVSLRRIMNAHNGLYMVFNLLGFFFKSIFTINFDMHYMSNIHDHYPCTELTFQHISHIY
jgi:hypothetical protein